MVRLSHPACIAEHRRHVDRISEGRSPLTREEAGRAGHDRKEIDAEFGSFPTGFETNYPTPQPSTLVADVIELLGELAAAHRGNAP